MIVIGTRGSELALWQANFVKDQLAAIGIEARLEIIKTSGDKIQNIGFDKMEGKGFFTKELEDALLAGSIDLAVHSMKDMQTSQPEGLCFAGVSYRDVPSDWLIMCKESIDESQLLRLKKDAVVGTSSARRKAQLLDFRPDFQLRDLRGNVPTRVSKLLTGEYDAIMLAGAGLSRLKLDLSAFDVYQLNPKEFVPAPAQGVMAFQVRSADIALRKQLQQIHHPDVSAVTNVERKVLKLLDGGCQVPVGVFCERDKMNNYHVFAVRAETWDAPVKRVNLSSATTAGLAEKVVSALLMGE
jgi:hydroxymethylbilane synthase